MRRHHRPGRGDGRRARRRFAGGTGVFGSSHREAPRIMLDPSADNTDVYAFTAPDAPDKPDRRGELDPAGGPGGRPVLRQARSDGSLLREDRQHRRRASRTWPIAGSSRTRSATRTRSWTRRRPVDSVNDPDINFVQTYDLCKETYDGKPVVDDAQARATTCRSRRPTRARRRCRTTPRCRRAPSAALPGGGKTFVGPSDDPFFVDLGAVFDGINIDKPGRPSIGLGNQGGGKDDVAGYNTHSFVLQVPESEVTRDGKRSRT